MKIVVAIISYIFLNLIFLIIGMAWVYYFTAKKETETLDYQIRELGIACRNFIDVILESMAQVVRPILKILKKWRLIK